MSHPPHALVNESPNNHNSRKYPAGKRPLMSIASDNLKCVAFICIERQEGSQLLKVPIATAFFVSIPVDATATVLYLITARHVIEEIDQDTLFIRLNRLDGGVQYLPTAKTDWWKHDAADVAAILYSPPAMFPQIDSRAIPIAAFVSSDYRCQHAPFNTVGGLPVELGHELYFPSLFVENFGQDKNLPIVRFGQISRMPALIKFERDQGHTIFEQFAYLAEFRSWGGHSGSPVFWMYPITKTMPAVGSDGTKAKLVMHGDYVAFLGLVSAHYDITKDGQVIGDELMIVKTKLNAGIGVITPGHFIVELLQRPDLVTQLTASISATPLAQGIPTMDLEAPSTEASQ